MPATALIRKPIQSKSVDLALCQRLAQEACRRASAAGVSWACAARRWLDYLKQQA